MGKTIYAFGLEVRVIAMSKKLGKIDKPLVKKFKAARKLFCVPLLFAGKEAPKDYQKLYNQYWSQVKENVEKLERAGKANKIYHEVIFQAGKEGLELIKQQNMKSHLLVKSKMSQGAKLIALEDSALLAEYLDWGLCLSMVRSYGVASKIQEFYIEAEKKRDDYIVKQIDDTLKKGEAGVLLMKDESRIRLQPKLPADINVFLVHPPSLNDISQWIRNQLRKNIKKKPA